MERASVLIVDDEEQLRKLLARTIGLEGFSVQEASSVRSALKKLEQEEPDAVLCDVRLPDGDGVDLVKAIKAHHPLVEVVLLTAYGTIADGVQAVKNGAFDYITKGDDNARILPLLHQAVEKARSARRAKEAQAKGGAYTFDSFIGTAPPLLAAIALGRKVAATDATVLLLGETGTGKEVMARAIHAASRRAKHPFVAINCSAIGRELLESELFGHVAGAFSGAVRDKRGHFQEADGGTLLLDEMGEMPGDLQAKLLRVLEDGTFHRVGEAKVTKVDVRIIAATNRDLRQEVDAGRFRSDLFYRLAGFQLHLPALRERPGDIALLARHFIGIFAARDRRTIAEVEPAFIEALCRYPWPGNIRELRNVMERSVILLDGETLTAEVLPAELRFGDRPPLPALSLAAMEQAQIAKVLRHTGGNKTEAARLLGIGLTTLYRKIEEYGIG
ncbi:MAG: sigma-54-dependent Fis family transcriptional regulator [Bacteroidetes bacterium]|nr:sigma-54-dependent Fis family transcriptional regulator [Bacteroidota bacterium]